MNRISTVTGPDDRRGVSSTTATVFLVAVTLLVALSVGGIVLVSDEPADGTVQAGVTVDQSNHETTITWSDEGTAERISFSGDASASPLTDVGDSRTFDDLEEGDIISVAAEDGDDQTVIRTVEITTEGAADPRDR